MLAAYLRGLLKPSPQYGMRSSFAEGLIIEGMAAQAAADGFDLSIKADASKLPILSQQGKHLVMQRIHAQMVRCQELRMMDIYKLDTEVTNKNGISLYQLYQLADKQGILSALREHRAATANQEKE